MNIGFDAKRAFNNSRGLGNYSRDVIYNLIKTRPNNSYYLFTTKISNNFLQNNTKSFNIVKKNSFFSPLWRTKTIVKDLLKNNINLYHGLSNELPLGIEKTNIKRIVTIHDLLFIKYPAFYSLLDRYIYMWKTKRACSVANHIIAISNQTKNDLIHHLKIDPNKISVLYQTCNQCFQSSIDKNTSKITKLKYKIPKNYLLFVGAIEKRKNLLALLKILNSTNKNLVVIGEKGNAYKDAKKYIDNNTLNNRVVFYHNIKTHELPVFYDSAICLVFPSINEGFGIPIIEALFRKTPVICLNKNATTEAGGNYSIYINSVKEIPDILTKLKINKNFKQKVVEEGYRHAQLFSTETSINSLYNLYTKIYNK